KAQLRGIYDLRFAICDMNLGMRQRRHAHFLAALLLPLVGWAGEPSMKTYTFKTFDSPTNALQADVYRPPDDLVRPVIVFIQGGALMMGGRQLGAKPGSLLATLLDAGYVVASIDYRLAPQAKLPAILEDIRDAFAWVRQRGPELFHIDPNDLSVMG